MKEILMQNWKPIVAAVLAFGAVGVAAYHVNFVYIPGKQQERAQALDTQTMVNAAQPQKEYSFEVDTSLGTPEAVSDKTATDSSTNPANDRIKVTTDADGNVTVDRTWDAKPGELDTTTTAPSAPTANIGSGGGKITGEDGAYHGEQPTTPPAESKPTPETKPTPPATGDGATQKPSEEKPTTPPTTDKPAEGNTNSTPKSEDTRVVNGKEQVYLEGFGWIDVGDGGHTEYWDVGGDSGIYVGEMG